MDEILQHGDSIRNTDFICGRCLVCIEVRPRNDPSKLLIGTGIVLASANRSCFIVTSSEAVSPKQGCTIRFHDGVTREIERAHIVHIKRYNMSLFPSTDHDMVHWETANISENEAKEGQKVFTCGYNSNVPTRRFISESVLCGAGIENNQCRGFQFLHGCATGKHGQRGSAVFSEEWQLMGMNSFYTTSNGFDYCPEGETDAPGGLVSAFDLRRIKCGIQSTFRNEDDTEKTFQEVIQKLEQMLA